MRRGVLSLFACLFTLAPVRATEPDWPQWRGPQRDGVWPVHNLPTALPAEVMPRWRQPIGGGFGGIAVAAGRVFVMDRQTKPREVERVVCLKLDTGEPIWVREYPVKYAGLDYGNGPRSTPTVHANKVYAFGAMGQLHCLDAATGKVLWQHDCVAEFKAKIPTWGHSCSPLIDGDRVLVQIGGDDACLVAFDSRTGKVVWRSLQDRPGYASPVRIDVGKSKQVIMWTPENINGVDAQTGKLLWAVNFPVTYDVSISDPVWHAGVLLCSQYWEGSKALTLDADGLNPKVIWEGKRLRQLMSTPLVRDGHVYTLDREHGLMCFELKTGQQKWAGEHVTPPGRNPQATLTWTGDGRTLILNEKGELILARLLPEKFEQISKTKIFAGSWAHPAYAQGNILARDDKEIVCVKLVGK